jgi:xylulokinase
MNAFLGIDIGTSGTKTLAINPKGRILADSLKTYPCHVPKPLWSEQDPEDWWQATIASVRDVMKKAKLKPGDVKAIGLSGQMHGSVFLDKNNKVIRRAILWNDQRTAAECDEMRERIGRQRLIRITGNDALTGFTAPKILWVRNNEPETFERAAHVLLPKDYVRFRLTDAYAVDRAGGAGTILFDLAQRTWSTEILNALDLDPGLFPPTFEGHEPTGLVTAAAAEATGLVAGTPVVAGAGDQGANGVAVDSSAICSCPTARTPVMWRQSSQRAFCSSRWPNARKPSQSRFRSRSSNLARRKRY